MFLLHRLGLFFSFDYFLLRNFKAAPKIVTKCDSLYLSVRFMRQIVFEMWMWIEAWYCWLLCVVCWGSGSRVTMCSNCCCWDLLWDFPYLKARICEEIVRRCYAHFYGLIRCVLVNRPRVSSRQITVYLAWWDGLSGWSSLWLYHDVRVTERFQLFKIYIIPYSYDSYARYET